MSKKIGLLSVLILVFFVCSVGYTEYKDNRDYFLGEIVSVIEDENKIIIFDYVDERKRTFIVENGIGKDLKPGIEIMVSALKGTDIAKKIKIVIPRSKEI